MNQTISKSVIKRHRKFFRFISKHGDKGSRAKLNKRNGIIVGLDKLVEDMVESWGFLGG